MNSIIKIEKLSKQYRLGIVGTGTISNDLKRWYYKTRGKEDPFLKIGEINDRSTQGNSDYVWALRDINLEIMPGEVLGIIGKNGAGKSTLLKILSKVTGPTTGRILFNGRIGSLLEVGTGFHQELTGRENIFLNGAILGMTKAEIRSKLDEIIEFSGCERYIDTPVKRYSSGMMVRLGFAVAAHLEPEILVVDEVLAVGDAEFQKKAIGKMQDVSRNEGRTVLFVSHNMAAVRNLCSCAVLLENGKIKQSGKTELIIESYISEKSGKENIYYPENNVVTSVQAIQKNDKIELNLNYKSKKLIKQPVFGFIFYDNYDNPIFGTNPLMNGILNFGNPKKEGEVKVIIKSPKLADGSYPVSIWFHDGLAHGQHVFKKEKCLTIRISDMDKTHVEKQPSITGRILPECDWSFS